MINQLRDIKQEMQGMTNKGTDLLSMPYAFGDIANWETRISHLFDRYCRKDSDPQCCSSVLTSGAHYLHGELSIRISYHHALKEAFRFIPEENKRWGWHSLIHTPFLRLGLISLNPGFSVPLHDHPNTYGVLKVVSGRVRIRQYQFATNTGRDDNLVSLERVSDSVLVKGKSSAFTPSFQNLHELESLSYRTVALSMLVNPYRPQDRSWYYQVPYTLNRNTALYNRIRRRQPILAPINSNASVQSS